MTGAKGKMQEPPESETMKAGVAGFPVSHSLSPKLHGYWLKKYGIDGSYVAIEMPPQNFESSVKELIKDGYKGINVTVPNKEAAFKLCDEKDELAEKAKAVNTLVFKNGKIHGYNTDVFGFSEALRTTFPDCGKQNAVLLGAGGAARGVILALQDLGFKEIIISNRTREKAEMLAAEFGGKEVDWNKIQNHLEKTDLLINCTSLGLSGKGDIELDLMKLPHSAIVYDIVYKPLETGLIKRAKTGGYRTLNGLRMLAYQAVPGFEMWFGKKPEVTAELLTLLEKGG